MLTPDFTSSAYPIGSTANANSIFPLQKQKRVRFAPTLIKEFMIPHRRCKLGLPVSTERLLNQIFTLRNQLRLEREAIDNQSQLESELYEQNEKQFEKYESKMTIFQLERSISILTERNLEMEEEIFSMKMDILRLKGLLQPLLKQLDESERTKDTALLVRKSFATSLAQEVWSKTLFPIFEGSWAA
jgi:hypothetical protein